MSSTSSSDFDDIETDGFPPENANNARFISLKSNYESLTNQKIYLPISSWNSDFLPLDIVRACVLVLKDSAKLCELEKKQILQQLEIQLNHNPDQPSCDTDWYLNNVRSPHAVKPETHKSSAIKVNIQIPSSNVNSNNIRYGVDKPAYDIDLQCWKTSMNFIIQNDHENGVISESFKEVDQENKEIQTESKYEPLKNRFESISTTNLRESRSKSEDRLLQPDPKYLASLDKQIASDADIMVLEKIEASFGNTKEKLTLPNMKATFRNYTTIIKNTIESFFREMRKMKVEHESLLSSSYDKWTEAQFKWHAQNQLFLSDIEKQVNLLEKEVNTKNQKVIKYSKCTNEKEKHKLEEEIRKSQFVYSVRLVSQMLSNLKAQIITFRSEVIGKEKKPFFS